MYVLSSPDRSAKSSCDKFRLLRNSLILLPTEILISIFSSLRLVTSLFGMMTMVQRTISHVSSYSEIIDYVITLKSLLLRGIQAMSNVIQANVLIRGIRPMLIHHFGPDAIPLERREKSGVAGNDPEEWKRTVLMADNRQIYVPCEYILANFRAGSRIAFGPRGGHAGKLTACLQIASENIFFNRFVPENLHEYLNRTDASVYLDVRGVKQPTTKARNVRYRVALSSGWQSQFSIVWDKTIISRDEMHSIVIHSGQFVGLGDGRTIGFGRYTVEEFVLKGEELEIRDATTSAI